MEHQLYRTEQIVEQQVSEHHLQIVTQMNRVAKSSMSEQRASLIAEAIQALQQCAEGTARQLQERGDRAAQLLRARDELDEQLNNQFTSLGQQTAAELQTHHQQTLQLKNELTRVTEARNRLTNNQLPQHSCWLMKEKELTNCDINMTALCRKETMWQVDWTVPRLIP